MKAFLLGLLSIFWSTLAMGGTLYTFNGGGTSGSWTDASIWTTDPTGSTSINPRVPSAGDAVFITNSFVVYVSSPVTTTGLDLTIQRGGVLDLQSASATFATLNSLAGQGTLRIAAPYFPTVTTNNFDDANTGTVEFYNWPAGASTLPIPAAAMYNNLRLLNTGAAGSAFTAQLDNNLTLNGGLTLTRTNTTAFPAGSSFASAAAAASGAGVSFTIGKTASTNRVLSVKGDISLGAGTFLGVTAVAGTHTINVDGSFVNNGTVNLHNGTTGDTQVAVLVFTGATNANFANNGDTDLDILRVDKGIDSQVLLNVTSTVNVRLGAQGNLRLNHVGGVDMLQLVNGNTKLGNNIYLAKISNDLTNGFSIGSSATSPTLWVAGATVVSDNSPLTAVYGTYHISAGQFQNRNDGGMVIREDGQVLVEGGLTQVNKFRPSRTSSNHRGSFIISGGVFECTGTTATSVDDKFARFCVPYLTQGFRMTGGTIRTQVPNTNGADGLFHIGVTPNNAIVTGGTVEIILPASAVNGKILTTAPLWNLVIKKSGTGTSKAINMAMPFDVNFAANATTAAQPLIVKNNFTLDATNPTTFDANSLDLTIQGTFTINSNSTYLTGTNTTIFSGDQDQQLFNSGTIGTVAGSSTFSNWTVDKSAGTLQLAGSVGTYSVPATATLSLLHGVLNDGGKIVYVTGDMINSASHTSGGGTGNITLNGAAGQTVSGDGTGVFGNLKLSNTAGPGAVGVTFAANMSVASTLTMVNENILAIGSNRLSLTNVISSGAGAALVTGPGLNFGKTYFIQTAGNQSDLGLQKTFGKGDTFVFPVGTGVSTGAIYAPATITLQLATGAPLDKFGQVSVSPVKSRSPFVTGTNNLNYYWKVRSTGFGPIPAGSVYETFQATNSLATPTTLAGYVPGRYIPITWSTYSAGDITVGGTVSTIAFNNLDNFPGEFTAGVPASFGPVTAYYTRASGNWETPGTWSTAGFNGTAATVKPGAGNPVFIETGRVVTVTANTALAGSLEIANGGTLDVQAFTGLNFGALPDSKPGGSGLLRIGANTTKSGNVYTTVSVFPGGDFGSFLQAGGGTVEYYTGASGFSGINQALTLPTSSATSLALTSYNNLWLDPVANSTITLPNLDLRIFSQLKTGTASTYTGNAYLSGATNGDLRTGSVLTQAGGLHFTNGTARTLTVDNDIQVNSGASFDTNGSGAAVANSITLGGSVTNNGTLDLNVSSKGANLTFTGSTTANLTGPTGALTDLSTLTLNKGTGRTATLNVDVAGTLTTPSANWLTLTNGTLRFAKTSGTLNIHNAESPYLITDNAGLTVDASGATVTVATGTTAASDLKLAGEVRVLQGTLNVGTTAGAGSDLEYASAGAPTLKVTTGTLYVNGQIRRSVNNLDGSLRFDQSGGTINIDGLGATAAQNNERGLFEVQGPKSVFRMSGGTLNLRRSNGRPTIAADFYLAPDSTVVTGGTVLLGNTYTSTGATTVSVSSTVPIYNLRVENGTSGSTNTGLLTGVLPLTLLGSLTIGNDFSFFNANGLPLNIYQNLINNNTSTSTALNAGGFQPTTATQTTSFLGGIATQSITGTASNQTVFGSLVMDTPQTNGKLQLNGTARTAGTLTLTKGTFDDNGFTLTALGDVVNSATHSSPSSGSITLAGSTNQSIGGNGKGRFGNLTLNNAAGATTTANQEIMKTLALNNGVLLIGSNLLDLTYTAGASVTTTATLDDNHCIRTNGIVADLGVRKSYPTGGADFTFPVGVTAVTKYTPVRMNVASATAGTITVQPINIPHPSTTDNSGVKNLSYYWKVSSTGLSSPTATQVFSYVAADVNGNEALYKLGRFLNGSWTPVGGITGSVVNTTNHTLTNTNVTYIDGDYTGGETSEFGIVPTFYSRNATAGAGGATWTDPAAWTFTADGSGPIAGSFPTAANPVVILPNHLINSGSAGRGAASLVLNGTLNLGTNLANNFGTVSGTGTMRIASAIFPAGNYANFVAANTGTVDFTGNVQLPARDTYNNLSLSGGTAKLLSNLDLTINGTFTVAANTQVDNPSNQNLTLTSATSGATINGTFNLFDGNLTTGASLTSGSTGTLNLGAGTTTVGTTLTTLSGGTINQSSGLVSVGTSFGNAGTFNGNVGQIQVAQDFTNSGSFTAGTGDLNVNGKLTNTGDFQANGGEVNAGDIFSNSGSYTANMNNIMHANGEFINVAGGNFDAGNSNIVLRNNFTNRGSFAQGTSLVQFITDVNRSLTGSTTFYDLQKLGNSSLTLGTSTDVHVVDLMTIQNSVIYTGANTNNILYLDNSGIQPIVGNTLSSYVVGRLAMSMPNTAGNSRVFPVGAGQRYRPVTIKNVGGSTNAVVLVEIINGAPAGSVDATLDNLSANRYYRIQLLTGSITSPTIQLSFNTDVIDETVNVPGNLRVAKTTGPIGPSTTWSTSGGAGVYSPDAPRGYTISASGQTAITANTFFALASTNRVDNPLTGSAPLPVTLVSFSATRQGAAVQVAWATASEKNSAYFVVERSANGRTFEALTRVEAHGNSTARIDYNTLDRSPLTGTSYYRLRQVDKDGTTAYSNVATVRFDGKAGEPSLVAYPNPATGKGFQLAAANLAPAAGTVQVFDNVGRLVFTQTVAPGTAEATVQPARPLASGMYFATWTTADGVKLTTKVSVE